MRHQIPKRPAEGNSLLARVRDATWTLVSPRLSLPEIAAALQGPSAVAEPTGAQLMEGLGWHDPMGRHSPKPFMPFLTINTHALPISLAQAGAVLTTDFTDSRKPNIFCPTYTSVH